MHRLTDRTARIGDVKLRTQHRLRPTRHSAASRPSRASLKLPATREGRLRATLLSLRPAATGRARHSSDPADLDRAIAHLAEAGTPLLAGGAPGDRQPAKGLGRNSRFRGTTIDICTP
ncbi:hypothetical protein GCM10010344_72310 [Streptomyces bluensis]|nr:hypothetical protein GCM10010344_72310 [Streptomyces bluensis]